MSSITINGDTSGSVVIQAPAVAGSGTVNIPTAASGTMMVSGTMPAFSAYSSSTQSVSTNTWTKVQCGTKEFDTNNNYDNTTNYRFTPTIAGYYQVNGSVSLGGGSTGLCTIGIYKNGSIYKNGMQFNTTIYILTTSCLIYCNGSTDYIELYGYNAGSGGFSGSVSTYFQASMVRAA